MDNAKLEFDKENAMRTNPSELKIALEIKTKQLKDKQYAQYKLKCKLRALQ